MKLTPENIPALLEKHGSLRAIAKKFDVHHETVCRRYRTAVEQGLMEHVAMGAKPHKDQKLIHAPKQRVKALKTKKARHSAYILTSAQNNTLIHESTWENLKALAEHYDAKIFVSTFLYSKRGLGARNDKAQLKGSGKRDLDIWFDDRITPYINNDRVEIAKGLVWCGELNILPTAEKPLRGLESYTGRASMIVPHTHLQMQSIPTVGGSGTKFNYTTGTVTLRNYIQRKEGFKAEFHHIYGALLVETDDAGHWWVRQLNADSNGTIHDLDVKVEDGKITTGNRVEAITFGDVHVANIDPDVAEATWGEGGMVDVLQPRFQFIHDVFDGYARSHHAMKDPYKMFKRFVENADSVSVEVDGVAEFLTWIKRPECQTVVVNSNHDRHLGRWLAENDGRKDPVNMAFWSWLNNESVLYIQEFGKEPDHLKLAIDITRGDEFCDENNVLFLGGNDSFVICPKSAGGIECALHFDIGAGGSRGTLAYFAKMGRRSNGGHSHTAGIDGGAFQAGTKTKLRLEYNHGPSAWSHSDIITHENGKRQIVTFYSSEGECKWRA